MVNFLRMSPQLHTWTKSDSHIWNASYQCYILMTHHDLSSSKLHTLERVANKGHSVPVGGIKWLDRKGCVWPCARWCIEHSCGQVKYMVHIWCKRNPLHQWYHLHYPRLESMPFLWTCKESIECAWRLGQSWCCKGKGGDGDILQVPAKLKT